MRYAAAAAGQNVVQLFFIDSEFSPLGGVHGKPGVSAVGAEGGTGAAQHHAPRSFRPRNSRALYRIALGPRVPHRVRGISVSLQIFDKFAKLRRILNKK